MNNFIIIAFSLGFGLFIYLLIVSILKQFKKTEINTKKRLDSLSKEKTIMEEEIEKIRTRKKRFTKVKVSQKFSKDLITSGISLRPEEFVVVWICLAIIPGILMYFLNLHILSILAIVLS